MTEENSKVYVAPSILACDFAHLADEVHRAVDAGADYLHVDVMDGHFVPNLSMGPAVCAAVNRSTEIFLDVHLMIYNPYDYVERFIEAGADRITFHFEATEDVEDTINYIRKCNKQVGLAFCPETSHEMIPKFIDRIDLLLLMTVHPGFGGQEFMPEVLEKIAFARKVCDTRFIRKGGVVAETEKEKRLPPFDIQVDGGITDETAKQCIQAGANHLVAGTYLFKHENMAEGIAALKKE